MRIPLNTPTVIPVKIVSVVNYKGGVGKTTLTANLGAGLAARGNRVLLIDLDPQASLTFSFFTPAEFQDRLAAERTIKKWYDSPSRGRAVTKLADLIVTPERVNRALRHSGQVDMIVSHQDLVTVDTLLADAIDKKTREVPLNRYVKVFRRLRDGLSHAAFAGYSFVLIDCPPNLNMMTKNAVVASDFMVIPCRPDYLSTNGIDHLGTALHDFINTFNREAQVFHQPKDAVVFTMVTYKAGSPLDAQGLAISRVGALNAPIFKTHIYDRRTIYPVAAEAGVPAILINNLAAEEMNRLIDELVKWTEGSPL